MRKTCLTISFILFAVILSFGQLTEKATVYFASDKHGLTNQSKETINQLIKKLENKPIFKISLIGHTDNDGSLIYNQKLSKKRTEAVADYLSEKGFMKSIMELDYYGETSPATVNNDEKGKQTNRRVAIIIHYSEPVKLETTSEVITYEEEKTEILNLENFAPQFTRLEINPVVKTNLPLDQEGTVLHIPKNCFVDKNGQPVKDKVTIEYKEYQNSADIAFSNIPMTYTQNGEEFFFNSSGMFEIQGTVEGEPVSIAPNQKLTIDYALAKKNPDLRFYRLNENGKDWEVVQNINKTDNEKADIIDNEGEKADIDNKLNEEIQIDILEKEITNFVDSTSSWSIKAICSPNDTLATIYIDEEEVANGKIISEKFKGKIEEN